MSESLFLDELLKLANEVYLQISSPVYIQCFTPKHLRTRKAEWQVYKGLVKLKLDQTQHLSPPAVSSTREWIKYQSNFLVGFSSWRAMPCQLVGVLTLVAWLNEQVVYCLTAADVKPPRIHCRQAGRILSWCTCLGLTRHSPATLATGKAISSSGNWPGLQAFSWWNLGGIFSFTQTNVWMCFCTIIRNQADPAASFWHEVCALCQMLTTYSKWYYWLYKLI